MTEKNNNSNSHNIVNEPWYRKQWRPAVAWLYLVICAFDFIIFPILWSAAQYMMHQTITQYTPITVANGGLIHVSLGSIIGISAYTRGQELIERTKINGSYDAPVTENKG